MLLLVYKIHINVTCELFKLKYYKMFNCRVINQMPSNILNAQMFMITQNIFATFYHSNYFLHFKTCTAQDIFSIRKMQVNQQCPLHAYGKGQFANNAFSSVTAQPPHLIYIQTASQSAKQLGFN